MAGLCTQIEQRRRVIFAASRKVLAGLFQMPKPPLRRCREDAWSDGQKIGVGRQCGLDGTVGNDFCMQGALCFWDQKEPVGVEGFC